MLCHVMLCYAMLCAYVMLRYVKLCCVMVCYVMRFFSPPNDSICLGDTTQRIKRGKVAKVGKLDLAAKFLATNGVCPVFFVTGAC